MVPASALWYCAELTHLVHRPNAALGWQFGRQNLM